MPLTFTADDFTDTKPAQKLTFDESDFSPKAAPAADSLKLPVTSVGGDIARSTIGAAQKALEITANEARGALTDAVDTLTLHPEYGGNLTAAVMGKTLPVDVQNKQLAQKHPYLSAASMTAQGAAGSAPFLLMADVPAIVQRATALGFSAQMISGVKDLATQYGDEMGKPEKDRDPAKIAQLRASLIQTGVFAPTAGAFGGKKIGEKVATKVLPENIAQSLTKPRTLFSKPTPPPTPGQPSALPVEPPATSVRPVEPPTDAAKPSPAPEASIPTNKGGAEADLPPEQKAISQANNKAAAEQMQAELDAQKPPVAPAPVTEGGVGDTVPDYDPEQVGKRVIIQRKVDAGKSREQAIKEAGEETQATRDWVNKNTNDGDVIQTPDGRLRWKDSDGNWYDLNENGVEGTHIADDSSLRGGKIIHRGLKRGDADSLKDNFVKQGDQYVYKPTPPASPVKPERSVIQPKFPIGAWVRQSNSKIPERIIGTSSAGGLSAFDEPHYVFETGAGQKQIPESSLIPLKVVNGKMVDDVAPASPKAGLGGSNPPSEPPIIQKTTKQTSVNPDLAKPLPAPKGAVTTGKAKAVTHRSRAADFNKLVMENAETHKWGTAQTISDAQTPKAGKNNVGSAGITGDIRIGKAIKRVLQQVAKDLGLDPDQIGSEKYRSQNLDKLKQFIGQKEDFDKATTGGDESGKLPKPVPELEVGGTLDVDGEPVKVTAIHRDYVELEDGRKFGIQRVDKGETLYVEGYEPPKGTSTPKLRPGEGGTGDLLQENAPFNLAGESGVDAERIAAEKAKSEADRKANEEFQSKNQPELVPLGASTPEDLRSSSSTPTGIKITAIDAQRAARGEEPLSSVGRRSFKTEVWQATLAKVDNDPQAPAKLVNTMMSDQVAGQVKPLSDGDVAMLLYREAELTYERSRLAREMAVAADDARQFPKRAEDLQRLTEQKNRVDEDLNTLEKVIAPAKSETARGLAALRNMVGDSYNLESMRYDFQKKTSHPLTEADEAFIKTEFERIDAAEKQRLKDEAEYRAAEADAEANRAREDLIDSVGREPKEKVEPVEPHVRLVAEKLKNYFKTNADAALERIRARHNGTTSMFSGVPLHPEDFDDAVIFGASKMFEKGISGAEMSADWATEMASTFGDGIKSLLQTIWAKANQSLDAGFKKIAGVGPAAEKAKRATRPKVGARDHVSEKKAIVEGIREAVADGEGDVNIGRYANAIAKNFVRQEVESGRVPKDIKGEEIDAAVHEVLKDFIPEISPVESRDAWTQYGKFKPATQDPIKIRMAEARSEQQKLSTIERLQKGLPGLMTGFGRAKATDLLRRRIAQINELKRQLGIVTTDPATQLRSALEAKLTRQKNRIADLKFENSTRKRIVREKTPSPDNEEALRNKAEIAELEKQNREIFGNRTLSDAQKLKMATAAAEKSAKDWEQKLVDAKQGKFAKPQAKKPLTSKELEAIKARRDAAKAEFKELQSLNGDFQREQRAKEIEREKDALEKSIAEKEKQIKSGDIAVKKQPVKPSTPELDALKKRRDDLNDQIRELRKPQKSPEEIAVNRRLTQLANRTADYLDRAARQDFKPKPKRVSSIKTQAALQKVATATSKADAAKKEWSNAAEKYRIAHRTTAEKVVEGLADTYHLTRAVAVLYHGTVGMITHAGGLIFRPNASVIWWRNFIRQFPMWLSPKYHEVIIYKLKTDPDFQTWKDAGASIDPNEVYTDYGLYGKMFGKFTGGSRGFDSLKLTRMELNKADWKKVPSEIKNDPEQASLTRKRIAEINNRATGAVGSSRDIFSEVAKTKIAEESGFAPRLYASRWGRVVLDPIKTAKTALNWKTASAADKYAAKVRLRNAGYFIGGYISALAINQGLLIATGSKERVNMADPTKSDWLKFKVGGKVITADGGLLDPVRLLGQIVIGDLMMPRTKKDVFLHGNRFQKAGMDILKYGRGKINPSLGLVVDVGTGSDYSGRPLPFSNEKPQFKDQTQYSVTEYLLSKGPIPLSIASKEVYDEMVKNGMSSVHAMDIVKGSGVLVFTMTGAHLTEDYKFDKETAAPHFATFQTNTNAPSR
jgi:hypothetical protein